MFELRIVYTNIIYKGKKRKILVFRDNKHNSWHIRDAADVPHIVTTDV